MNGRHSAGMVTIKEYIDERLRAHEKAVEAALNALNRAATKDDAKISLALAALALLVSIGTFIYLVIHK
jgi:hypothetical protein